MCSKLTFTVGIVILLIIIIIIIWFKHQYLEKIFPIKSVTHHKHLNSDINNESTQTHFIHTKKIAQKVTMYIAHTDIHTTPVTCKMVHNRVERIALIIQ